jgi:hypothetical protein
MTARIMPMINSNNTIRNRTRDLPACSAVPQPTAPPRDINKEVRERTYPGRDRDQGRAVFTTVASISFDKKRGSFWQLLELLDSVMNLIGRVVIT